MDIRKSSRWRVSDNPRRIRVRGSGGRRISLRQDHLPSLAGIHPPGGGRRSRVRAMIRICFAGVTGWTAPPILAAIDASDDLALTSGVSRSAAGQGQVYASVAEA